MSNAQDTATETTVSSWDKSSRVTKPSKVGPTPCDRCGGAGGWKGWPGFTCFRCGGNGTDPTYRSWVFPADWTDAECAEWDDRRIAANAKRRATIAEKKQAAVQKAVEDFLAAQTDEDREALQAIRDLPFDERHGIADDIIRKLHRFGSISQAQIDLAIKVQEELAAKAEEPELPELVEGRRELTGIVVSTKTKESVYGTQYKMLVELDDGNRVYGTIPSSIDAQVWDTRREFRVTFTAEVTVSGDDEHFGWYKRPTKASAEALEDSERTEA